MIICVHISYHIIYTLWLFNIAMGNGPFTDDFPIKTSIYKGFSMAMLVITKWCIYIYIYHIISYHIYMPTKDGKVNRLTW